MTDVYDAAVAGGGPAGAVAALEIARAGLSVILVERSSYDRTRVGETLPPIATAVLGRLGLEGALAGSGAVPSFGNESAWGDAELRSNAFVFDAHGDGHHVDRRRFDAILVETAESAGAHVTRCAALADCMPLERGWSLRIRGGARAAPRTVRAAFLVDATGRRSSVARRVSARRELFDHLVGVAAQYAPRPDSRSTLVESVEDGWWYSAPVPRDRLVVMFMSDADICSRRLPAAAMVDGWEATLRRTTHTLARLAGARRVWGPTTVSAVTHRLRRHGTDGCWLAVGDAALGVDPLSSSGIMRALTMGEAAAHVIVRHASDGVDLTPAYERWLDDQLADYLHERREYYELERRWPDAPFWRRRHADTTPSPQHGPVSTSHEAAFAAGSGDSAMI